MTRHIYLVIYSNGSRPAHQALFIPTKNTGSKGKVIHVTGNTATGFFLQFKRNYDFALEDRKYQVLLLAEVDDRIVRDTDTVGNGEPVEDTIARDRIESVATTVLPPGRSPNPFGPDARNCQHWTVEFVERLVQEVYLSEETISIVENAPKNL